MSDENEPTAIPGWMRDEVAMGELSGLNVYQRYAIVDFINLPADVDPSSAFHRS